MNPSHLLDVLYLIASVTFVIGLKLLSHPESARRGNRIAAVGMALAIVGTLFLHPSEGEKAAEGTNIKLMIVGIAIGIGTIIGLLAAYRVKMTAMPQMVSIFNGLGGGCAALLAIAELKVQYAAATPLPSGLLLVLFTLFFGAVSFSGSMLAFAKLEELVKDKTLILPRHNVVNLVFIVALVALMGYMTWGVAASQGFNLGILLLVVALIYGVSFVAPIGGADMPVVISVLNSFTGLTAAAAGLIYDNLVMMVGGILVGASGSILTVLMCKAMNRSLLNVLIGSFGGSGTSSKQAEGEQVIKEVTLNDAAVQLYYSQSVVVVPGYGLAVAQAQKVCKELDELLSANGVEVKYAIHPVAGRMPGHMNVLLAEADVPYPKLLDLEDANAVLQHADIAIIVGANDVVNPAAEDDPGSPIYGMPVLKVWDAKHTIVLKRSMRSGYAGIENPLFFHKKTTMLFGDAKDSLQKLVAEVKTL